MKNVNPQYSKFWYGLAYLIKHRIRILCYLLCMLLFYQTSANRVALNRSTELLDINADMLKVHLKLLQAQEQLLEDTRSIINHSCTGAVG